MRDGRSAKTTSALIAVRHARLVGNPYINLMSIFEPIQIKLWNWFPQELAWKNLVKKQQDDHAGGDDQQGVFGANSNQYGGDSGQ